MNYYLSIPIDLHIPRLRSLRGLGALLLLSSALFSLSLARSHPLKKKSLSFARLFRVLLPDLTVLVPQLARPMLPRTPRGSIWRPKTAVFSRFLRAASIRRAKRPTSIKHWQERYETHFGAAARWSKTFKNRSANASNCVGRCEERERASWESSQTLLERLRSALRPPLGDSWPLWTRQGCPRIGFGAARGGSKGVPGRSGRVPETALGPSDGPKWIFPRCWVDSNWIFCDFRCDIALILLALSLPLPLLVRLLLATTSIVSLQFPPSFNRVHMVRDFRNE